ncbi:hypothetical protein D9M71_826990 [compost metagenome]
MGDGAASGHPADIAGIDHLVRTEAVLVLQLAFKEVGERGETNMRMLADVHAGTRCITGFEHMVEKHEGPDIAAFG